MMEIKFNLMDVMNVNFSVNQNVQNALMEFVMNVLQKGSIQIFHNHLIYVKMYVWMDQLLEKKNAMMLLIQQIAKIVNFFVDLIAYNVIMTMVNVLDAEMVCILKLIIVKIFVEMVLLYLLLMFLSLNNVMMVI